MKIEKGLFDIFVPDFVYSEEWEQWMTLISTTTCAYCWKMFGKIFRADERPEKIPPAHYNCRCEIIPMFAVTAGNATRDGHEGADYWVLHYGRLPDCYITKEDARAYGWIKWRGNLAEVVPGRMIGGNIYQNRDQRLPDVPGRVWYEADINYQSGYRNLQRIVFSNDGLIFATYNHFISFVVIKGG